MTIALGSLGFFLAEFCRVGINALGRIQSNVPAYCPLSEVDLT